MPFRVKKITGVFQVEYTREALVGADMHERISSHTYFIEGVAKEVESLESI